MTIKEALNQIDHKCIDEDLHFYDFRSLYESMEKPLTDDQKKRINDVAQKIKSGSADPKTMEDTLTSIRIENNPALKNVVDKKLNEDADSLQSRIFDYLDELGGYIDYDGKIEALMDDFGLDRDYAESFVWDWSSGLHELDKESELEEKLVDAPQEVIDELVEILDKYGFVLDDSIGHENPSKSLLFGDTHIQVINPDSFIDDTDEISVQEQLREYISREMIDEIHSLDQESDCPITWNFGLNNKGQVTGGLDVMKQYISEDKENIEESIKTKRINYCPHCTNNTLVEVEDGYYVCDECGSEYTGYPAFEGGLELTPVEDECLTESLDISSYQRLSSTLKDGGDTYALFRKIEDGKGKWAAAKFINGEADLDNAFEITYEQARGFEPISDIGKIGKDLGKMLLPKNESLNEASEPTDEDWEDFYKLEEEIANVMHGIDSDLDDAQANIYHDDYDGTRRLTFRFVCGVDEISDKIRKQIINTLENYLNKTKFNQFIYIRLYPVEVPVGASYEVIIDAETEPSENLNEASYGGAYDIEDDMFFTKEEIVEFVDDIINELSAEFGKNYFIEEVGFTDPTNLYISIEDTGGYSHSHTFHIDMRRIRLPKDIYKYKPFVFDVFKSKFGADYEYEQLVSESINEDTVKQNGKWVNKGKEGTHGKFATKKAADAQRKAMFASGYQGESLEEAYKHLNNREKQVYIDIINNPEECEDIDDLKDIVHEIFFYDKALFAMMNKFPKDASFEELKANKIAILKDSMLDESLKDDMLAKVQLVDSILHKYPDLSSSDEDYFMSLSLDDLKKELNNRGLMLDESLKEDLDDIYEVAFYLNTAGRERRPVEADDINDFKVEDNLTESDLIDLFIDLDYVYEEEDPSLSDCLSSLSSHDFSDGGPIIYQIIKGNDIIYDDSEYFNELEEEIYSLNETLKEDLIISPEKEYQSKSGHRILIKDVTPYMSEYDGTANLRIKYDYKLAGSDEWGSSECNQYDLFKMLNEDYERNDDSWGEPYSFDEVERELKKITNDWSDQEGTIRCYYEQEKQYGMQILKKHYDIVEPSDGRTGPGEEMSWVIAYARPKMEESLNESFWFGKYTDLNKKIHKVYFEFDSSDFEEAEEEFDAIIPEPYVKATLSGKADKAALERDGFTKLEESLNIKALTKPIIVTKDYTYDLLDNMDEDEIEVFNKLGFIKDDKVIIPKDTNLKYVGNEGRQLLYQVEGTDYILSFNNIDGMFERDFNDNFAINESLNESRTSNLQDKIVDCLDWFIMMEMEFPKNEFLADSWEDLKDGIQMGIDPEFEVAEGIVEYLKPIITFNKQYQKDVEEEGVFQDEIDMYNDLVRAMNNYLVKNGYEPNIE